jgi:AcrR family transcriptional regulator
MPAPPGTPPRRTPRLPADVRREQLLDAALDVIAEDGFAAVSVEAVARRAGVTRPVVYDQFGDLEGLLVALVDREERTALDPLLAIVGGDPGDDVDPEAFLVDAVGAFLDAVRGNPRTWRLVLMPPRGGTPELRKRIASSRRLIAGRIEALLDWGVARRGGPLGLDHALAARLIVAAGEDAARLTLVAPTRYPAERLAGLARTLLAVLPAEMSPRGDAAPVVERPAPPAPPAPRTGRMPRSERREQLLDVALDLLAEEGFDALSMEAIARRAGVNRAIVYRSFANLQLLLVALLRREDVRTKAVLEGLLPTDPGDATTPALLGDVLASFLTAVLRDASTYRVVLQRPENAPPFLQKVVNRRRAALAQQLRPLVEWGLGGLDAPTADIDPDVLSRMLLSIGEELARLALDDPDFPPERIMAGVWGLLDRLPLGRA